MKKPTSLLHCYKTLQTFENTREIVFSTFPSCSEMPVVFYHSLLYGKLCERARSTKSGAVIGYLNGQNGAILPARDYPLYPTRKIFPKAI